MIIDNACRACRHFKRWEPTKDMQHPQFGHCTDEGRWGKGGIRLVRDDDTCDAFKEANHHAAA